MEFNIATELNQNTISGLASGTYDICILEQATRDTVKEFGELLKQDLSDSKEVGIGNDEVNYNLAKIDMGWHNDSSHLKNTHKFAALFGVDVHTGASPTYFCNMKSVWRDLSEDLKNRIKKDIGVEFSVSNYYKKAVWPFFNFESKKQEQIYLRFAKSKKELYQSDEFGEYLFYSPFYTDIEYLDTEDIFKEEYIYKHYWNTGNLVVWNNMTLSHRRDDTPKHITRKLVRYAINIPKN